MNTSKYKPTWNSSVQPRKQRLFRFNAPAHIKGKFLCVHLSKDLRTKYGSRSVRVRVGDKVKVVVGQFKGNVGTVERVDVDESKVFITKVEQVKKDGTKALYPIHASNLLLLELKLDDKYRIQSLDKQMQAAAHASKSKSGQKSAAQKPAVKVAPVAKAPVASKPAAKVAPKPAAK